MDLGVDETMYCHGNFGPAKNWSRGPNLWNNGLGRSFFPENFVLPLKKWSYLVHLRTGL